LIHCCGSAIFVEENRNNVWGECWGEREKKIKKRKKKKGKKEKKKIKVA